MKTRASESRIAAKGFVDTQDYHCTMFGMNPLVEAAIVEQLAKTPSGSSTIYKCKLTALQDPLADVL